jgi:hypothetical protein
MSSPQSIMGSNPCSIYATIKPVNLHERNAGYRGRTEIGKSVEQVNDAMQFMLDIVERRSLSIIADKSVGDAAIAKSKEKEKQAGKAVWERRSDAEKCRILVISKALDSLEDVKRGKEKIIMARRNSIANNPNLLEEERRARLLEKEERNSGVPRVTDDYSMNPSNDDY